MKKSVGRMFALGVLFGLGILLPASCRIRIETGAGDESIVPPSSVAEMPNDAPEASPEELAAEQALTEADPNEAKLAALKAQYTAYALQGMIEQNVSDPSTVDDATIQALIDQYLPTIWEDANLWVSTIDLSLIPLADVMPRVECENKYLCRRYEACHFGDLGVAQCIITGCGEGPCPACPTIFGPLKFLVVSHWCTHTCLIANMIVGIKFSIHVLTKGDLQACLLLDKPVAP